jgi:hypothetical protein
MRKYTKTFDTKEMNLKMHRNCKHSNHLFKVTIENDEVPKSLGKVVREYGVGDMLAAYQDGLPKG